jgi:hypothetical protein
MSLEPLSRVSSLVIVSLIRLETIEELPQFPHERAVTQSTNHFHLPARHLGFRTSVHSIDHVSFLGPLFAAMPLGHTYLIAPTRLVMYSVLCAVSDIFRLGRHRRCLP